MRASLAESEAVLRIDREDLLKLEKSLTREWLETNGRGAYASSTIVACATRKYHGLLVSPIAGSVQRHLFLSSFEETLHGTAGERVEDTASDDERTSLREASISLARYGTCFAPQGHRSIECFELCPWPRTTYRIGRSRVRREVLMVRDQATVLVRYTIVPEDFASRSELPHELRLRPLVAARRADELHFENLALNPRVRRSEAGLSVRPYEALPELCFSTSMPARFEADPVWYSGVEYSVEMDRGYGGHEDLFAPGVFHVAVGGELERGFDFVIAASIDGHVDDPAALWARESAARVDAAAAVTRDVRGAQSLVADDFLYRDEHGREGIVAGWPWFLEWGRDTFLSLPGLTLARGQIDRCSSILEGALPYLHNGLLPNIYGRDIEDSHYGSVDAALWFARAVRLYENAGGERVSERFLPALREIAVAYRDGACGFVHADANGLIRAGRPDLNATWMDARASDGPVTPRDGFAVEINALWCFLLRYLELLEGEAGDASAAADWAAQAKRAESAFLEEFWLEDGYLADTVKDAVPDAAVRPNMVFAASFEFSPLTRAQRASIVAVAKRDLVTPRGLRTLSPAHAAYKGRYRGDQDTRDRAYHQGTVWPWLLGAYVEASLRADGARAVPELRALLDGFGEHLLASGLQHVSEVFDGDPPHRPGGTIAQAWSCAEILRSYALLDREAAGQGAGAPGERGDAR